MNMNIPKKIRFWKERFVCSICRDGRLYYVNQEIGQLNCSYHEGGWDETKNIWKCCKKEDYKSKGCIRCDHMPNTHDNWYIFNNDEMDLLINKLSGSIKKFDADALVDVTDFFFCIRRTTALDKDKIKDNFNKYSGITK